MDNKFSNGTFLWHTYNGHITLYYWYCACQSVVFVVFFVVVNTQGSCNYHIHNVEI